MIGVTVDNDISYDVEFSSSGFDCAVTVTPAANIMALATRARVIDVRPQPALVDFRNSIGQLPATPFSIIAACLA